MPSQAGKTKAVIEPQVAALPVRAGPDGGPEVLLITSRETRRWVIPKGNLMKGLKKAEAAYVEAREEAGVKGKIAPKSYRTFDYWKRRADGFTLCRVEVFLLFVSHLQDHWKEAAQRRRIWIPAEIAATMVQEPGLQSILNDVAADHKLIERLRELAPVTADETGEAPPAQADRTESEAPRRAKKMGGKHR